MRLDIDDYSAMVLMCYGVVTLGLLVIAAT